MLAGASFVVADKPTGDSNNSPNTTKKNDNTTHNGLINSPGSAIKIGINMTKNEAPEKNSAIANFFGVAGPRLPSFVQRIANNGAKAMMNNGFNDWNHEGGISKLPSVKFVRVSTNVARIVAD